MDESLNRSFDPNLMSLLEDAIDFAVYQIEVDPDDFYGRRIVMVSPSTAKSHVSSILTKLEVSTRTEAVSYALKNKLI